MPEQTLYLLFLPDAATALQLQAGQRVREKVQQPQTLLFHFQRWIKGYLYRFGFIKVGCSLQDEKYTKSGKYYKYGY